MTRALSGGRPAKRPVSSGSRKIIAPIEIQRQASSEGRCGAPAPSACGTFFAPDAARLWSRADHLHAERAPRRLAAARGLGLRPFRIPLAIDGTRCVGCPKCDAFACAIEAKNDLATRVIPSLLANGLELRPRTVAVRLIERSGRIAEVEAFDKRTSTFLRIKTKRLLLAAGALATPHLLLASGLTGRNPRGHVIGRFLMRHCNAMIYGFFPRGTAPANEYHKQVAINDFYFGDTDRTPLSKLGNIQQVMTPPVGLIQVVLPPVVRSAVAAIGPKLTGLLVIAEDQPRPKNRVEVDRSVRDRFGLPGSRIHHGYSTRDLAARRALLSRAGEILRLAGAAFTLTWRVNTFSHVSGTVRMGCDPQTSALDETCRFRGLDNLWISDGSVFPTSGGVNPRLTIGANALRIGELVASA